MTAKTNIVRLKITLDDVVPVFMRRVCVHFGIRLDRLHEVIQAAIGWTNTHLWELRAADTRLTPLRLAGHATGDHR